jgi:hypothetical protein
MRKSWPWLSLVGNVSTSGRQVRDPQSDRFGFLGPQAATVSLSAVVGSHAGCGGLVGEVPELSVGMSTFDRRSTRAVAFGKT